MLTGLGIHDFVWFVLSGLLLNITPGADSLFIAGHSAANGRRAGVLTRHGRRTLGVLFVGLGVKLALADR